MLVILFGESSLWCYIDYQNTLHISIWAHLNFLTIDILCWKVEEVLDSANYRLLHVFHKKLLLITVQALLCAIVLVCAIVWMWILRIDNNQLDEFCIERVYQIVESGTDERVRVRYAGRRNRTDHPAIL